MMEESIRDIHDIGVGYEWAKSYCRAKSGYWMHQIKVIIMIGHATGVEDPIYNVNLRVIVTTNFENKPATQ